MDITENMTLGDKLLITQMRIQQWYEHYKGNVFIAFSGGKDSTVLLHIVRKIYPEVKAVFSNTGLEYPEIVKFAESFPGVETIRPKKSFVKVLKEDGFPLSSKKTAGQLSFFSKPSLNNFRTRRLGLTGYTTDTKSFHKSAKISKKWMRFIGSDTPLTAACCDHLKKNPMKHWAAERKSGGLPKLYPYIGMMLGEGSTRDIKMKKRKCNVFDSKNPTSNPLKFWTTEDVWEYIKLNDIEICSVYKELNVDRTGCTFCAYGAEREKPDNNRFTKLRKSHPKQFNAFVHKFKMNKPLDYAGINYGEAPTHKPPEFMTYKCCKCERELPIYEAAWATEREWTQREELERPPLAGMDVYCNTCTSLAFPHLTPLI